MTIIKTQQDKRNVTQLSWWQGEVRIQFSEINPYIITLLYKYMYKKNYSNHHQQPVSRLKPKSFHIALAIYFVHVGKMYS